MPIELQCPGCERRLQIDEKYAGMQARCPVCDAVYAVPAESEAAAPLPQEAGSEPVTDETEREPSAASESDAAVSVPPEPQPILFESAEEPPSWHMKTPEGHVYGPVDRDELNRWVSEGRVTLECHLRPDDSSPWRSADQFYPVLRPTPVAVVEARGGYSPMGPLPESRPPHAPRPPAPSRPAAPRPVETAPAPQPAPASANASGGRFLLPHRGALLLTFGIISWIGCPLLGVLAWIMATSDLRDIKEGRMTPEGKTLTTAGYYLGMINVIGWVVAIVIAFFVMLLGFANE